MYKIYGFIMMMFIIGCWDKTVEPPIINKEFSVILPIIKGYWWEYNVSEYDSTGKESSKYLDTIKVMDDFIVNSTYYEILNKFPALDSTIMFVNKSDGTYIHWKDGIDYRFFAKYNGPGDLYYSINDIWTISIMDTNGTINTDIGRCNVLIYNFSNIFKPPVWRENYYYIAPGIGLVKYEKYSVDSKKNKKMLMSMRIKSANYK